MKTSDFDKYDNLSAIDVCEALGQPYRKHGSYCTTACYNTAQHKHGDKNPSLTVYGYDRGYYCFGCGEKGTNSWLLKQFGVRDDVNAPVHIDRTYHEEKPKNVSTDEYCAKLQAVWEKLPRLPEAARQAMEAKGFDAEMFEEMPHSPLAGWRWHTNQVKGWGEGIFIPYIKDGKMVTARLRRLNGTPRFLSMPGNSMYPYNIDAAMTNKRVHVTEGETDCLTLNFLGLPAVGIPGATSGTAIARLIEQAKDYGTELVVIGDNDEAGETFAKKLLLLGYEHKVAVSRAYVPFGKDVNEWYLKATAQQVDAFLARQALSQPKTLRTVVDDWLENVNFEQTEIGEQVWNTLVQS